MKSNNTESKEYIYDYNREVYIFKRGKAVSRQEVEAPILYLTGNSTFAKNQRKEEYGNQNNNRKKKSRSL